ncbi:ras-related protein rab-4B-like protein [Rhizopus microsporus var. microsporus]|uniref:Ras-related protein rab-4B-like protein n=3 Tax=Rhizopus microsporus TaxID=58291 RepID=A0A2G4SHX7_RHIZD|nr:ras-related protein rab-4B-like protein [Rhizopus microsporus ATCC 52813]ORE08298.1 ras-related protein rab-4B-like protein [Rhizopus microsporus var. microsporus]ORE18261.1 ras-related protein rab-4B-like protein [Rhizopus microsporus]PHZ08349.1 ras-related protein rab-4B-like protein [Rhizopus microsporus ATCC 52813]
MLADAYDFLLKLLLVGDSGTGKSCLLYHFLENQFKKDSVNTIGMEFGTRIIHIGDKSIKLQIWDTAGQERFRSLTKSYFRGAAGALVVYDVCNRDTFLGVRSWLRDVRTLANPELVIILVGNKNDKADEREVSYLEASRFAQEHEMMFLEASALSGDGVEDVFFKCARSILSKIETGQIDPERSGSGVQFGDSSFRRMTQRTRIRKKERSCCSF